MPKYNSFRWDPDDELFPELELALHEAAQRGYSVVELSRIMGNKASRNLYGIMRNAGIIAKLPRGRAPKINTTPGLLAALETCGLSFYQWANSHDLDPAQVAGALLHPIDTGDVMSVAAHNAFKQDFRQLYCKTYRLPVEPGRASVDTFESILTDYHMTIAPDRENDGYRAYVHELDECTSFGRTRDDAYFALKSRYVLVCSIKKLRLLPDKRLAE